MSGGRLALALLALVLLTTGPGLFSGQDIIPGTADSDAHLLFHAQRGFVARCLRAGELPFWNPYNLLGQPLYAAGQTGATYPPGWLLYPWMGTGRALFADLTLHLVLLGLGGAALARAAGLGNAAATTAAGALAVAPMMLLRVHAGQITLVATVAWLPWIAAGLLRISSGAPYGRAWTALAIGLAGHAGHLQELYYLLALGIPFWIVSCKGRGVRDGLLAVALGLCLAAPQLLATAELAARSGRAGTDPAWVNEYSARFTDGLALLGADAFGERVAVPYWGRWKPWEPLPAFGFATLLAAALAPLLSRRPGNLALWGLVLATAALALGRELPVSTFACAWLPGWARFRDPARVLFVALVALALLAARAAAALADEPPRQPRFAAAVAALVAIWLGAASVRVDTLDAAAAARLVESLRWPGETFDGVDVALVAPRAARLLARALRRDAAIALALSLACALATTSRRRIALWLLLGAMALEYLDAGLPWARTHPPPRLAGEAHAWLEERPADSRVDLDRAFVPTLATGLELEAPGGSASLLDRRVEALLAVSQRRSPAGAAGGTMELIRHDGLARLFGVARAVGGACTGAPPPGLAHVPSPAATRRFERADAMPRAWVVHALHRSPNDLDELAHLSATGFDPAREVVVGADAPAELTVAPSPAVEPVRVLERERRRVVAYVRLASPGVVVFSDAWDPGWTARVNGQPVPVLRANHGLRALALPSGAHTMTLTYEPPWFLAGVLIAGLALIGLRISR